MTSDTAPFRINLTLFGNVDRQDLWNKAANKEGLTMREWATQLLDNAGRKGVRP